MREAAFQQAYPMALRAAQVRSAAAIATTGLPADEREDLEQQALMGVWLALPRYDSSRASVRTFVERVVASRVASLLRARRRRPRFDPIEEYHAAGLDEIPALEFQTDCQRVAATLAERDRRLVALLLVHSPTEVSRVLRISRSTVYEGIRRIQVAFQLAGYGPRQGKGPEANAMHAVNAHRKRPLVSLAYRA